jgi:transcriptional regulator with XRE-family HTH domain
MDSPKLDPMPPPAGPTKTLDQIARERIRAWIRTVPTTQAALAEAIGRNPAWMSRYLAGDFDADLETLQRIAQAFGHSIAALLDQPADPVDARVLSAFHALPPDARANWLNLLEAWSRPRRGGRLRK